MRERRRIWMCVTPPPVGRLRSVAHADVQTPLGFTEHAALVIRRGVFLEQLAVAVPESGDVAAEHLADNDGLLLHPLMSDLLRMTVSTYSAGEVALTDRLLAFIERCLREGDDYVVNAVAVSFVEDFGADLGESDALLDRWPPALRAELGR
jgi:hypothetical protein